MKYDHIIIQNIGREILNMGKICIFMYAQKKYYTYNCRKYIPYKTVDDNRVYN